MGFRLESYPQETHPNWHLPYNSAAFRKKLNSKIIIDRYDSLSAEYGYKIFPQHDEIIQISRFLRNDSTRLQDAVSLMKWSSERFANSVVFHETLADTYMKKGDNISALQSYEQALKLSPENLSLRKKIEAIKNPTTK